MAKKTKKKSSKNASSTTEAGRSTAQKQKKADKASAQPSTSPAFAKLQAAYDAGNYALTRQLAGATDFSDDEQVSAQRLRGLTQIDPVILGLGVGVVLLVLVVGLSLLTHA